MRWVCGVLGAVAGCSFSAPQGGGDPGPDAAGGTDGLPRTCAWDYEPLHFDPCDLTFADPPPFESGRTYLLDTDDQTLVSGNNFTRLAIDEEGQGDGVVVAIWPVTDFDFKGARLRVIGTRALMIASDRDLIVRGDVDVGGVIGSKAAGADHVTACVGSNGSSGDDGGGGGGGGGAGAVTAGASGQGSVAGTGGPEGKSFSLLTVRGGCSGGAGGAGGGGGGAGGGAVYLAARGSLRVDADIYAGGGGGEPGVVATSGGGGGGSGGQIGIEATSVELSSVTHLIANGGGGGGGSSSVGAAGMAGAPAPTDGTAASGGLGGGVDGGTGGQGSSSTSGPTTTPGLVNGGGGGGGGARGRILIRASTLDDNALISPTPALATF